MHDYPAMYDTIPPPKGEPEIAHIFSDEKFIDSARYYFELVAPGASQYFLVSEDVSAIKYIKTFNPQKIDAKTARESSFVEKLNGFRAIVFHSMRPLHIDILKLINKDPKVAWVGMGFDYLPLLYRNTKELFQANTYRLYVKPSLRKPVHQRIFRYLKKVAGSSRDPYKEAVYALGRTTIFSPVLEREFRLISQEFHAVRGKYLRWNYGMNAKLVDNIDDAAVVFDENILIGNSADPRNNHIETFELLSNYELGKKRIIVPLSYGSKNYAKFVMDHGRHFFGSRFEPIMEFMDYASYIRKINSCSYVFMNHNRQQAGGNILIALFSGAKLFLNQRNLFYEDYLQMGIGDEVLACMNEDGVDIHSNTAFEYLKLTRAILKKERGTEQQIANTQNLVDSITLQPQAPVAF